MDYSTVETGHSIERVTLITALREISSQDEAAYERAQNRLYDTARRFQQERRAHGILIARENACYPPVISPIPASLTPDALGESQVHAAHTVRLYQGGELDVESWTYVTQGTVSGFTVQAQFLCSPVPAGTDTDSLSPEGFGHTQARGIFSQRFHVFPFPEYSVNGQFSTVEEAEACLLANGELITDIVASQAVDRVTLALDKVSLFYG